MPNPLITIACFRISPKLLRPRSRCQQEPQSYPPPQNKKKKKWTFFLCGSSTISSTVRGWQLLRSDSSELRWPQDQAIERKSVSGLNLQFMASLPQPLPSEDFEGNSWHYNRAEHWWLQGAQYRAALSQNTKLSWWDTNIPARKGTAWQSLWLSAITLWARYQAEGELIFNISLGSKINK